MVSYTVSIETNKEMMKVKEIKTEEDVLKLFEWSEIHGDNNDASYQLTTKVLLEDRDLYIEGEIFRTEFTHANGESAMEWVLNNKDQINSYIKKYCGGLLIPIYSDIF